MPHPDTFPSLLRLLHDAARLDMPELDTDISKGMAEPPSGNKPFFHALMHSLALWGKYFLSRIKDMRKSQLLDSPTSSSLWGIVSTRNQYRTLHSIFEHTPNSTIYCAIHDCGEPPSLWLCGAQAHLIGLAFMPLWLVRLAAMPRDLRRRMVGDTYRVLAAYGMYVCLRTRLHRSQPDLVMVASDHGLYSRLALTAARHAGVRTAFAQHATTGDFEPALSADVNLLLGRHSLMHYREMGQLAGDIFLCGSMRVHAVAAQQQFKKAIGIGCALDEPIPTIITLARLLRATKPEIPIIIRWHPRDWRADGWKTFAGHYDLEVSDPTEEKEHAFLSRIDFLCVSSSHLLLDALEACVPALAIDSRGQAPDPYGFFANNLAPRIQVEEISAEELAEHMDQARLNLENARRAASFYLESIGTAHERKGAWLAAQALASWRERRAPDSTIWQTAPLAGAEKIWGLHPQKPVI